MTASMTALLAALAMQLTVAPQVQRETLLHPSARHKGFD